LPLTLNEALRDDDIPLRRGSMQIIRRHGRRDLLYFDPSKLDKTQYSRESACRALWYWFHALLEDEEVQKRGVIILNYNANFSNRNRDPPLTKLCFKTLQGTLPVRVSAIHGCHVPIVYSCIISILLVFMGERVRRRILAHNGTVEAVIQTLQNVYDIHADDIPIDMGGNLKLDVCGWLDERKAAGL
jgi:CRAL/TRIO domain